MGWGLCTLAGVAGKGETLDVIPRFLITGRRIAGTSFGGAKGRDRVPELVRLYLDGPARPRRVRLPSHAARRRQPRLRADGAPGRRAFRAHLQLMIVERSMADGWLSNSYVVGDRPGGHAILVDAGGPTGPINEAIERFRLRRHPRPADPPPPDHVAHLDEYRRRYEVPGARPRARGCGDRRGRRRRSPTATSSRAAGCGST